MSRRRDSSGAAPRGRQKGPVNPVLEAFAATGIPVLDPARHQRRGGSRHNWPSGIRTCSWSATTARSSRADMAVSHRGGVNLHGSLLPKYRGAAPVNWAIWQGEAETGVTVIHMTPQLDGGPCLAVARTAIGPDEDAPALEQRLSLMGVQPVLQAIEHAGRLGRTNTAGHAQDAAQATRAPRLKKSDGEVDWSQTAAACESGASLRPWPGTYT